MKEPPSFSPVGVTGFEPATTRPPDAYSNRAELHPELLAQIYCFFLKNQIKPVLEVLCVMNIYY